MNIVFFGFSSLFNQCCEQDRNVVVLPKGLYKCLRILSRVGIWKCCFSSEEKSPEYPKKTLSFIPSEMLSSIRSNQMALSSCPQIHRLGKICQSSFVKQERQARRFFFIVNCSQPYRMLLSRSKLTTHMQSPTFHRGRWSG